METFLARAGIALIVFATMSGLALMMGANDRKRRLSDAATCETKDKTWIGH